MKIFWKISISQKKVNYIRLVHEDDDKSKVKVQINFAELEEKELIGSGASAEVKIAKHKSNNLTFALKVIPLKFDAKMKQLIEQEVRALHNCKHENIIKCFASFYSVFKVNYKKESIKIVLEYMDKGTLADLLKKLKKIPENMLGMISLQVFLCYLDFKRTKFPSQE